MNIFLTGASGTLGGYILRELLAAGHTLSNYDLAPPAVAGVKFIEGDINDIEQLKAAMVDHDVIVHLAAVPGPGRATPAHMMQINLVGTVNVLEAARATKIQKVVYASSGAATGFTFPRHPIVPVYLPVDEEHPCQPHDEYGLSKLLAEIACKSYSDAFGITTICLRINNNWYVNREQAEIAVNCSWAKKQGISVDELWDIRYRKTIEDPDGEYPVPGPPPPRNVLWAVTDARDATQGFRLAVENDDPNILHEVFFILGYDTCSKTETPVLLSRHYRDVPLKTPLKGYDSLWSHAKATRLLGYKPQYTWRNSDFSKWLQQRSG